MELLRFLFKSFCMLTLVWIICEGKLFHMIKLELMQNGKEFTKTH